MNYAKIITLESGKTRRQALHPGASRHGLGCAGKPGQREEP
jgi:hypothetical protein